MTQSDSMQPVTWREVAKRSSVVVLAAIVVLVVQAGSSCYGRSSRLSPTGVEYLCSGWPAVSCVRVFEYEFHGRGAPVVLSSETQRSAWGYALNGATLLGILTLAWNVDRMGQPQQFELWRLFVVMLACSVILACLRAADGHNARFLQEYGVPVDSPQGRSVFSGWGWTDN